MFSQDRGEPQKAADGHGPERVDHTIKASESTGILTMVSMPEILELNGTEEKPGRAGFSAQKARESAGVLGAACWKKTSCG